MTANQINYGRNLELERSNKANESLQRQKMWNDWMIANLQAQTAAQRMATDVAINKSQIESKEFVSALDRQQSQRQFEEKLTNVEIPNVAINVTDSQTRQEQTDINRQKSWLDFVGHLVGATTKSGFMSLF